MGIISHSLRDLNVTCCLPCSRKNSSFRLPIDDTTNAVNILISIFGCQKQKGALSPIRNYFQWKLASLSLERKCTMSLSVITGTKDKHLALHGIALTVT